MQRMMEDIQERHENRMKYHRQVTMEEIDMNDLKAIKRKLNSFRIRLESRDFKNAAEEAAMRAKSRELYEHCRVIAPEEVSEYETFVRREIRRKAKKDVKKVMRHRR